MSFKFNNNVWILFGNIEGNDVKLLLSNLNVVNEVQADTLLVNELKTRLLFKSKLVKFVFADKSISKLRILLPSRRTIVDDIGNV